MIHFAPTVVFDFPFTVNKLPLEVDLVRALLPQVRCHLRRGRVSSAAAVIASCVVARRAAKSIPFGVNPSENLLIIQTKRLNLKVLLESLPAPMFLGQYLPAKHIRRGDDCNRCGRG